MADQATRMWWSSQNVKNLWPVNCVPLSVMMVFGAPEPVDDISEEQHHLREFDLIDRTSLDPLGELIDCYQQMGVAPGGLL